jgi:hypothetical protein
MAVRRAEWRVRSKPISRLVDRAGGAGNEPVTSRGFRIGSFWARRAITQPRVVPSPDPSRRRTVGRGAFQLGRVVRQWLADVSFPLDTDRMADFAGTCSPTLRQSRGLFAGTVVAKYCVEY